MSWAQSVRAGETKSSSTSDSVQVGLHCQTDTIHYCIVYCKKLIHTELRSTVFSTLTIIRKSPVLRLYSSVLAPQLQSDSPTHGPPSLPQLPPGYHQLYTHIEYECASTFYHHSGSSRRTCLKTGKWSGRHVSCSPGEGSRGLFGSECLNRVLHFKQNTELCNIAKVPSVATAKFGLVFN